MTPGEVRHEIENGFRIDGEVVRIGSHHVGVVGREDDRYLAWSRLFLTGRVLRGKRVGHVDKVGDLSDRFRHDPVIGVDSCARIGGQWWNQEVIRFESADGIPERGEEWAVRDEATFPGCFAAGQPEEFKLIISQCGGLLLFVQPYFGGRGPGVKMVSGRAIGAYDKPSLEVAGEGTLPKCKSASCDKFEIIKMGVDAEGFHGAAVLTAILRRGR